MLDRDRERGRARHPRHAACPPSARCSSSRRSIRCRSCRGSRCSARPPIWPRSKAIDLAITDGAVDTVETNAADITNLELTGQINAEVDGEALADRRAAPRRRQTTTSTSPSSTTAPAPSSTSRSRPSRSTAGGTSACSSPPPKQARSSARPPPDIPESGIEPSGGAQPRGRARRAARRPRAARPHRRDRRPQPG